jgi:hypothetical protein
MKSTMTALLGVLVLSWSSFAVQADPRWMEPVSDTVIVEVNGSKIIIQTDEIAEDMARIQAELAETAQSMAEVSMQLANTEDAEEIARLEAELARLEAELERIEAEMEASIAELEQNIEVQIEESNNNTFFEGEDESEWSDWDESYGNDSDDWDDWNWESDNGKGTVGTGDFFIGFNNYVDEDFKFPSAPDDAHALKTFGSWHWGFNGGYKTRIGRSGPLHVKYALEFEWRNYNLEQNNMIFKGDSAVMFTNPEGISYRKNRFNTLQFNIPVLLQLDWSDNRTLENGFNVGIGGYAGVCFLGYSKSVHFDEYGDRVKQKVRGDFYTNNFRYGVMAQIGFGWINFYARYDLNSVFREGRGPELNNFMFGIVL